MLYSMVSRLKKGKWLSSEQVSPKHHEESVPLDESENSTESLNSYMYSENSESLVSCRVSIVDFSSLVSHEENFLGRTSQLSFIKSAPNLRNSIQSYKIKSASRIQSFFRSKRVYRRCKIFYSKFKETSKKVHIRKAFLKMKGWVRRTHNAAKLIQLCWKKKRSFINRELPSPKRNLLKRTVSIGTKLIKIEKFIAKVVRSREPSPLTSPNHSIIKLFSRQHPLRSQSSVITLYPSICTEEPDTLETHTNTPSASPYENFGNLSGNSSPEPFRNTYSLVMKKACKIRTKKKKTLRTEELSKQLEIDENCFTKWERMDEDSRIPKLCAAAQFFCGSLGKKKESLAWEYEELAKE